MNSGQLVNEILISSSKVFVLELDKQAVSRKNPFDVLGARSAKLTTSGSSANFSNQKARSS